MRKLVEKFFTLSLGLFLISCQNDLLENNGQNIIENEAESYSIHVIYNENDYYSQCQLLGDSLVIENKHLSDLIDKLFMENDEVQTYVHDGVIEYFDNRELFEKKYKFLDNSNIEGEEVITRSDMNADGYAIVWEDENYKGWSREFSGYINRDNPANHWDIERSHNDKISSLQVHLNTAGFQSNLECFEDNNYKGARMVFSTSVSDKFAIGGMGPYLVPNLKLVPRGKKNWGDTISSLRFSVTRQMMLP